MVCCVTRELTIKFLSSCNDLRRHLCNLPHSDEMLPRHSQVVVCWCFGGPWLQGLLLARSLATSPLYIIEPRYSSDTKLLQGTGPRASLHCDSSWWGKSALRDIISIYKILYMQREMAAWREESEAIIWISPVCRHFNSISMASGNRQLRLESWQPSVIINSPAESGRHNSHSRTATYSIYFSPLLKSWSPSLLETVKRRVSCENDKEMRQLKYLSRSPANCGSD